MMRSTRRRQLEQSQELNHSGRMELQSLRMPAFFEYLHDHAATTDLAMALADVVMLRTSGARRVALPSTRDKVAS